MSAFERLAAAFTVESLLVLRLPRRLRPASPAPFTAHVLPQKWSRCERHHFAGFVSHIEPGCGCTPDSP